MIVSEIKLYELLKAKLGAQEAEAFVQILDTRVDKKFDDAMQVLATKEDIAYLRVEIQTTKADTIKWMFIFWIGQLAATIAIVKFLL